MCGRFNLKTSSKEIANALGFKTKVLSRPRYNIAPSQDILVARIGHDGEGEIVAMRWGLVPSWIKEPKTSHRPINAKAETASEKPFFRNAFKKRRCLIPVNGFYEWLPTGKQKQPFLVHMRDDSLFFLAGLWEIWVSTKGEVIESTTILTTNANEALARIHDRMPVILPRKHYEPWLDIANQDVANLSSLLQPYPNDVLDIYPVSTLVNSPKNDVPECVEPLNIEETSA